MTDEIIAYAQKKKSLYQQQQEQQVEIIEPPPKKRRGVFDFIKECEKIQREGEVDVAAAQIELDIFFKEKVVETGDVFEWWNQNKIRFPNIFEFIKKYLIIPATSVPAERVFSKAGEIICAKRSRLSRKRANELVFLNVNKHLWR